jgi:hypothetical protein
MEETLSPNQHSLLERLNTVLQDPVLPGLLLQLNHQNQLAPELPVPTTTQPTLLERMNGSNYWRNSNQLLTDTEKGKARKRKLSPALSKRSGRTLMSRLLNHKRMRRSTLTSPSSPPSPSVPLIQTHKVTTNASPSHQGSVVPLDEPQILTHLTTTKEMTKHQKDRSYLNPTCPGMSKTNNHYRRLYTPVATKPVGYYEPTITTSPKQNFTPKSHQTLLPESLPPSGNGSSKVMPSTSTKSMHHSTMLSLMKRERVAWETRRSFLRSLKQRNEFGRLQSGLRRGDVPQGRSRSPSLIEETSCLNMEITSRANSPPNLQLLTTESSSTTRPSGMRLGEANIASSQNLTNSADSTRQSLCQMASSLKTAPEGKVKNPQERTRTPPNLKSVTNSTTALVKTPTPTASTSTCAKTAKRQDMVRKTVRQGPIEIFGLQPKYLRHNLWSESSPMSPTTAEWTESARPLPRPPLSETDNPIVLATIRSNPELFNVATPINVDVFEALLTTHPNQPFVRSVCLGLREGFWPWADTLREDLPVVLDESRPMPASEEQSNFIRSQCILEQERGRFSRSFGPDLLPGMYSMPVHAVPKPGSSDLRLVTDHSAGPYSLNSLIDHSMVTGYPLDNLRHLGEVLLDVRRSLGNVSLVLWKSDISEAYRLMPVSPFWQIKQINTVDGLRYVDQRLAFGSSASPAIFISFNSLVTWIAKYVKGLTYLATYVDDSFGCDMAGRTLYYEPYQCVLPALQKRLLDLWDELGIPHKKRKQLSGSPLAVIGIEVDPNMMTLCLSASARSDLLEELTFWSSKPPSNSSGSFKLKHWERLAGWFNWALNVYPHLRPALNNIYAKMKGKCNRQQKIYINNAVRSDLLWAIRHIRNSDGIQLLKSIAWDVAEADYVVYCDACPEGLGFWYPQTKEGFHAATPSHISREYIFYFEALCVVSALDHIQARAPKHAKIIIYTDNTNTVDIFRSYHCLPAYNPLLKTAVNIILANDYSLRVLHVPGSENIIADALSRVKFSIALQYEPQLRFTLFNPPVLEGSTV